MDIDRNAGVWVWRVPVWLLCGVVLGLTWIPMHDAVHYGQVTPLITGILAIGLGRGAFCKGVVAGFATVLKPTFGLLIPFAGLAFGSRAWLGGVTGFLPALIPFGWFSEYITLFPAITARDYACNSPIYFLGYTGSAVVTCALCFSIALSKMKDPDEKYVYLIATVTIGTALWWHSYCPLIITIIYIINKYLGIYFNKDKNTVKNNNI